MTQKEMILEYMRQEGSITAAETMREIGCYRLAARIAELEAEGHSISRKSEKSRNRFGRSVTFTRYGLA